MSKEGICPICEHRYPNLQEHHVWPREYGGIDKGTVFICGSCHDGVHAQATNMMSSHGNKRRFFFTGATLERAMPYVNLIMRAALEWESVEQPDVKKRVIFSLKPATLIKIHKLKADHGYTSLDTFFEALCEKITTNQ